MVFNTENELDCIELPGECFDDSVTDAQRNTIRRLCYNKDMECSPDVRMIGGDVAVKLINCEYSHYTDIILRKITPKGRIFSITEDVFEAAEELWKVENRRNGKTLTCGQSDTMQYLVSLYGFCKSYVRDESGRFVIADFGEHGKFSIDKSGKYTELE